MIVIYCLVSGFFLFVLMSVCEILLCDADLGCVLCMCVCTGCGGFLI